MVSCSILMALVLLSPEAEVAGEFGEPDVYSVSMGEYVGLGMTNFDMKMLTSIYIDSIEVELDRYLDSVLVYYSDTPEMQEYVTVSHGLFLEYVSAWADVTEERMWWHHGVRSDGTARGYAWSSTLASWYWQKIASYSRMIHMDNPWQDTLEPTLEEVGGYRP